MPMKGPGKDHGCHATGTYHWFASCHDCDFEADGHVDEANRAKAQAHVRSTGHTVSIEKGYLLKPGRGPFLASIIGGKPDDA